MASISSAGIGSGLDVSSIISQLVALEKQPLKTLELKATTVNAKVSALGDIKSQFATLADVATRMSAASAWTARTASSSNTSAATITATSTAGATSFTLDVDALAQKQSVSSAQLAAGGLVGAGTMTIRLGTWAGASNNAGADNTAAAVAAAAATTAMNTANTASSDLLNFAVGTPSAANYATAYSNWVAAIDANDHATPALITAESDALAAMTLERDALALADAPALAAADLVAGTAVATAASTSKGLAVAARPTFTAAAGSADISITATASDTVATLAAKINAANAGVVATAFFDGTGDRLLLSSKNLGAEAGFRIQVDDTGDGNNTNNAGLSRMAYDPQTAAFGMASSGIAAKYGQDAQARINGLAVTSKTNSLVDNIPGVTIDLKAETTSSVTMSVSEDVTVAVKNVNDFVTAYNALNKTLADLTKYDAATKTASLFQADSSILGMQSVLRGIFGSVSAGSAYQRLSDVGLERQLDGSVTLNTAKLSIAANDGTELQKLFTTDNSNPLTNGFGLKFAALGRGLLAAGGAVTSKASALQAELNSNAKDQSKVNDRAAAVEARLRKTYTALDTKMAGLTALNQYVAQQVATWNKSTN